jgi:hypothetical protein
MLTLQEFLMDTTEQNILLKFFEQLNEEEQALLHDYLDNKKIESLSKSFDRLIEGFKNEDAKD